jgi:hypothetical protein
VVDPRAAFDYLAIVKLIGRTFTDVSEAEVHLFAYFACLLSVYAGAPANDWGYEFTRTRSGSPFAKAVSDAGDLVLNGRLIYEEAGLRRLAPRGAEMVNEMKSLHDNAARYPFIEAACSSVLTMPFGEVRAALTQEPTLRNSTLADRVDSLIEGNALGELHEQFKALNEAIGMNIRDLLLPAVIWLTFLARTRHDASEPYLSLKGE